MSSSLISTHILDTARGRGAPGVPVTLHGALGTEGASGTEGAAATGSTSGTEWVEIAHGETDQNGRLGELGPAALPTGTYRLTFDTGAYFAGGPTEAFYPEVVVTFTIAEGEQHYHVPLLLSEFAYSTYRGN